VIGWAGTAGGLRYLESLAPALAEVASRQDIVVRVISGAYKQACLPGVPVEAWPWRPTSGLVDMASFDIGLVPLYDSEFERAKFPFKLLQYQALGVPVVSARVGVAAQVIRHADNGLLAGSLDEWRDHLLVLVQDAGLRQRLGAAGRDTIAADYTIQRVGPLLADGLREVAT
jgi:glycosyltransferase involved in cell wall biosynthesis